MIDAVSSSTEKNQLLEAKLAAAFATGVGGAKNDQAAQRVVKEVVTLLNSDSSVRLTTARNKSDAPGSQVAVTGSPELDEPDSKTNREQDLEKLLLYLQLDTDESQTKMAQTRLQSQQGLLEVKHKQQSDQIKKNQEAIERALRVQKAMKALSWILLGISLIVTIATLGAAAGATMAAGAATAATEVAGVTVAAGATTAATEAATQTAVAAAAASMIKTAVQASTGFLLQLTFTVLGETGVTEKATKAMAKSIESHGTMDSTQAECLSAGILAALQIFAMIGGTCASGKVGGKIAAKILAKRVGAQAAAAASAATATTVSNGMQMLKTMDLGKSWKNALKSFNNLFCSQSVTKLSTAFSATSLGVTTVGQVGQSFASRAVGNTEADTRDVEAALARIQQMMDETVEEMQLLIAKVQEHLSQLAHVVSSAYETEAEIAQNMGQMA